MTVAVPQPTMKFLALTAIAAALIAGVSAHTRLYDAAVGGKDMGSGSIRLASSNSPVKDLTSPNLRCNDNGENPVSEWVQVQAGQVVTTKWGTYIPPPVGQPGAYLVLDHDSPNDDIIDPSHKGGICTSGTLCIKYVSNGTRSCMALGRVLKR